MTEQRRNGQGWLRRPGIDQQNPQAGGTVRLYLVGRPPTRKREPSSPRTVTDVEAAVTIGVSVEFVERYVLPHLGERDGRVDLEELRERLIRDARR